MPDHLARASHPPPPDGWTVPPSSSTPGRWRELAIEPREVEERRAAERFPVVLDLAKHPLPALQSRATHSMSAAGWLRLGHSVAQCTVPERCSCGATMGPLGYHLLCCNHGVERNWHHDTTRDTLADIIRQSGHAATTEKTLQALGIRSTAESTHPDKRLDIVCS